MFCYLFQNFFIPALNKNIYQENLVDPAFSAYYCQLPLKAGKICESFFLLRLGGPKINRKIKYLLFQSRIN